EAQQQVVKSIEVAAADLLSFYPGILPKSRETPTVYILLGAERGFCGDFNHLLLRYLETSLRKHTAHEPMLIAVGRKLNALLEENRRILAFMEGATVLEEVDAVLVEVIGALAGLQEKYGALTVYCLYHGEEALVMKKLIPPFEPVPGMPAGLTHPPLLNLSPQDFLVELSDHFVFAALHEMVYTSLMVENRQRILHLEGAVKHLDNKTTEIARRCNVLRQEEIIEEIEIILLNAAGPASNPGETGLTGHQDHVLVNGRTHRPRSASDD
ncbi:MAG: F0F1 ATP synthase subunit gamma, partial [Gammaproteobacteria bacterium]